MDNPNEHFPLSFTADASSANTARATKTEAETLKEIREMRERQEKAEAKAREQASVPQKHAIYKLGDDLGTPLEQAVEKAYQDQMKDI